MIARRDFIKGASLIAVTAATSGLAIPSADAQQVPNSTGTEQPKLKAPLNAADCHMHIYDPARFRDAAQSARGAEQRGGAAISAAAAADRDDARRRGAAAQLCDRQPGDARRARAARPECTRRCGRDAGDHRCRAQSVPRGRHPRHSLQPCRSIIAGGDARHGRAAVEARCRSRLACAVQCRWRDDRRDGEHPAPAAVRRWCSIISRIRRCRRESSIPRTRSCAS